MKHIVYIRIFGKKYKVNIEAKSREQAKVKAVEYARGRIEIVETEEDFFRHATEMFDTFFNKGKK